MAVDDGRIGRELLGVEKREAIEQLFGTGSKASQLTHEEKALAIMVYRKKNSIEPIPENISEDLLSKLPRK